MNEEKIVQKNIATKLAIIILVGILFVGGVLAFLFKYYELFSEVSSNVNKNPMQQKAVDLAQLETEYQAKSGEIVSNYLHQANDFITAGTMSAETEKARDQLLALKVTADDKAKHLAMVLMLEEIDRLAKANDTDKVNLKLQQLKDLSENNAAPASDASFSN
jgi:hypothetical protein